MSDDTIADKLAELGVLVDPVTVYKTRVRHNIGLNVYLPTGPALQAFTKADVVRLRHQREQGLTYPQLQERWGRSKPTIWKYLNGHVGGA